MTCVVSRLRSVLLVLITISLVEFWRWWDCSCKQLLLYFIRVLTSMEYLVCLVLKTLSIYISINLLIAKILKYLARLVATQHVSDLGDHVALIVNIALIDFI